LSVHSSEWGNHCPVGLLPKKLAPGLRSWPRHGCRMEAAPNVMRVAVDARSLVSPVLRGWDRYTVGLVKELVRQGVAITLFHRARQPIERRHIADLDCEVVGLNDRGGLHWEQAAVPLALWRGKFDLFHAPAEHGVPLAARCPVVLAIHSLTALSYSHLVERKRLPGRVRDYLGYDPKSDYRSAAFGYWRAQVARANHIVCPSRFCRGEILRFLGLPPNRVTAIPLAVHEQFQKSPAAAAVRAARLNQLGVRKPYLLYVGGYEPHKNVGGLLETFAMVRAAMPELSLVAVGSKVLPGAISVHAMRLGLQPGREVVFLVNMGEQLTDLYDDAELFVTLSWRETFCLAALEAMARGVPVVASAWGGMREVAGVAARLVDPRDHRAAESAILETLAAGDRSALGGIIRGQARRFTWRATAARTLEIYRSLIRARSTLAASATPSTDYRS